MSPIVPYGRSATSKAGAQRYNNEMMSSATPKAPGGGRAPRDRKDNPYYEGYDRNVVMGMPMCRHVVRHRYLNMPAAKAQLPKQPGKDGSKPTRKRYTTDLCGVLKYIRYCVQGTQNIR